MARPRESAKILEMKGAFDKDPQRRREDTPGAGPFNDEPPEHLPGEVKAAWRRIVERLPKVALTSTEELAVEQASRIYSALQNTQPCSADFKKLDDSLRQWLIQLGMTLQARLKLGTGGQGKDKENRFAKLKSQEGGAG